MDETEITKFDITIAQLNEIVAETKDIVEVDIENKEEIEQVKKARKRLGDLRVSIKKFGKSKRDWFNSMSSKIIAREKELVAIVETEEDRLYAFEEKYAKLKEKADRIALLPSRKFQLSEIKDGIEVTDDFLCTMNAEEFKSYCNKRVSDKNEKIANELKEREDEIKRQEDKIKHDQEIKDAEERARAQEKVEAEEREKKENERIFKLKLDARIETLRSLNFMFSGINEYNDGDWTRDEFVITNKEMRGDSDSDFAVKMERIRQEITRREDVARMEKEQQELEAKQKAEQEALEKEKKYQDWLLSNGYTEETKSDFLLERVGNKVRLSKIIGIYTYEKDTQTES